MTINYQVVGINDVIKSLQNKSKDIIIASKAAIVEGGMLLKEEIENSIAGNRAEPRSVKTGAFLASISSNEIDKGVEVDSSVDYSAYLEYGTSRIEERRHFRNSMDRVSPIIVQKVEDNIKAAIA